MPRRISIALIFLLVFGAGGVTGWFLRPTHEPSPNMIDNPKAGRRLWNSGSAEKRTDAFMNEFTRELELTPEQIAQLRPIVAAAMKQFIRYDREHLRLRKVAHDRAIEEIRPLLEPAQQEKLDELNSSSQKRFGKASRRVDRDE